MATLGVTRGQSQPTVQRWLRRIGVGAAALVVAVVASSVEITRPNSASGLMLVSRSALAQGALTEQEIYSYASAVLQMDGPRNQAYTQIKDLLMTVDQDVSAVDMTCTETRRLNNLPRSVRSQVRTLVVDYCNLAQEIVQDNGLTVSRFNDITETHRQDPDVAAQIRNALITLQQQSADSGEPAQP